MKVLTILGTRPELIRLSRIIPRLDQICDHVTVWTGQNFSPELSGIFFDDLGIRTCNHMFKAAGTPMEQISTILTGLERILETEKPDRFLVLGDTNSSMGAIAARRAGIPVYHMEAGNRCGDLRVPEEINRMIIDHATDVHLPYTERSRYNLLREGVDPNRIFVVGNPMAEVYQYYDKGIAASTILSDLELIPDGYFLSTFHRSENIDNPVRLQVILDAFEFLTYEWGLLPIIVSTHPHTRKRIEETGFKLDGVNFHEPFNFTDFAKLEQNAFCVLSDSGTVSEAAAILGFPAVVLRDSTERPEAYERGAFVLSGVVEPKDIVDAVKMVTKDVGSFQSPSIPEEYTRNDVSTTVGNILTGYLL